jgi:disulfide bond formation protein DsbB
VIRSPQLIRRSLPLTLLVLAAPWLLTACGGGRPAASPEQIAAGEKVFMGTCATCHGKDANGLPKLGKGLRFNEFVRDNDDPAMLAFIQRGRPASDPLNTTGVDMPPKGGNPALTEADLQAVIAYVRTLQ